MSTPPDQPNSPYQQPQPGVGGYGAPVPPQHNPYAQPSPYGPQPAYPGIPPQPGAAPGGGAGGRSGAGRAVLWAVVGAAVASALWGGGVLLLDKDSSSSGKADLRGYTIKSDLCASADLAAFRTEYPTPDSAPTSWSAPRDTLDSMACSESLKKTGSTYSDAYLSFQVDLHKKSDPAPEFADTWLGYQKRAATYIVTPVDGIGDEAYLVTQDTVADSGVSGSSSGSREVTLGVRDGWMTYSMSWSLYASSVDSGSGAAIATVSEATDWVKTASEATLLKLKK